MRVRCLLSAICLVQGLLVCGQTGEVSSASRMSPNARSVADLGKRVPELMKVADIPGLALAIIKDGRPYSVQAFGVKNVDSREPVVDDTVFEAASLSKPVFAYAVMKLVDEGKLELDKPLTRYLDKPYLPDSRVDQITARYVLSHRTGFPNWRPEGGELQIKVTPGERFSYSGEGFVYLAKVVERITGMAFETFMKKEVFDPLGMTSSSYVWRDDYGSRKARGHDGTSSPRQERRPDTPNAAASLHTTAGDYAKFVSAVVTGAGLKRKSSEEMLSAEVAVDPACTNCTDRTPSPQMSREVFWGLGWGVERTRQGDAIWHWGDNGAFRCFVLAYPKQRAGIIMFTNSENGLLIAPDVVRLAMGGDHPVFSWLKYGTYNSVDFRFQKALQTKPADKVIEQFRRADSQESPPSEQAINSTGYRLLAQKRLADAIKVFQWNVELHPKSGNVYDSLGEAYMTNGEKDLAIKNYEKSLELDPKNNNAAEMLKKLHQ